MVNPFDFYTVLMKAGDLCDTSLILNRCFTLRGAWKWQHLNTTDSNITNIFKHVHENTKLYLLIATNYITESNQTFIEKDREEFEYDDEWGICWQDPEFKDSILYHKLQSQDDVTMSDKSGQEKVLLESISLSQDDDSQSGTRSSCSSESSEITRTESWKYSNPAFNPRFLNDIQTNFLTLPNKISLETITTLIENILVLDDDEYVDINGDIHQDGNTQFGISGLKNCLKSAQVIAFFNRHFQDYSLDFEIDYYKKQLSKRKNRFDWIQCGTGYFKNFTHALKGNQDIIYRLVGSETIKKHSFTVSQLEEAKKIFKTGNYEKDSLGQLIYIFYKLYKSGKLPGRSTKFYKKFMAAIENRERKEYICIDSLEPISFIGENKHKYVFSKVGFCIKKSHKIYTIKRVEHFLNM